MALSKNTRGSKTSVRRGRASQSVPEKKSGSGFELVVLLLMASCVYLIGALMNSSWTGALGRELGIALRRTGGGALIVPLLFLLYLCVAWFAKKRIPNPLGQIAGTFQLYISLAFVLGLFTHANWRLSYALGEPGAVGLAIARFFVLNLGSLGTIIVAFASLALSAILFGFSLPVGFAKMLAGRFMEGRPDERVQREQQRNETFSKAAESSSSPSIRPLPRVHLIDNFSEHVEEHLDLKNEPKEVIPPTATIPDFDLTHFSLNNSLKNTNESANDVEANSMIQDKEHFPEESLIGSLPDNTETLPDVENFSSEIVEAAETEELQNIFYASEPISDPSFSPSLEQKTENTASENNNTEDKVDDLFESASTVKTESTEQKINEYYEHIEAKMASEKIKSPVLSRLILDPDQIIEVPSMAKASPEGNIAALEVLFPKITREEEVPNIEDTGAWPQADGLSSAVQESFPEVELPDENIEKRVQAGLFPPPLDLFGPSVKKEDEDSGHELAEQQADIIVSTLQNFGVKASVAHIVIGPSVIQFQLELAPGIKVSKVAGLANDLTMALAVVSVRVEAPILGQRYVGIEIPNPKRKGITLRSIVESEDFQAAECKLPLPMGVRVDSKYLVCGLEDMPHLLVAGTTGSGKSVYVNSCILGMCSQRSPEELKLILVDPKHVEFAIYEGLPHLLARPVSDPKKAIYALSWAVQEMERRSECFARAKVRNLASYNEKALPKHRFPHIVVVVDELADLMYTAGKEVEGLIARLAQKARAAGIHLILATQRPSVDVITGLIKANVPARVAFAVPSQTDSRTIIDTGGAEKLLGKGDMLFYSTRYPRPLRLQAAFITEERTLEFVEYMKNAFGEPEYIEFEDPGNGVSSSENGGRAGSSVIDDPKLDDAIKVVMDTGIASASGLQRYLNIGYPRAGRMISGLEQLGVVGPQPPNSSKPREILMDEYGAFQALDRARNGLPFEEE